MIVLYKKIFDPNARKALDDLKLEIANEFDAQLTEDEIVDGAMTHDLIRKAERKRSDMDMDTFNPS